MRLIDSFTHSRFGMFIHFGLYSIPAGLWNGRPQGRNSYAEWIKYQAFWPEGGAIPDSEYDALTREFNPTGFDAEQWVCEAKNAGMRYLVVTAKHHDGFALWDSAVCDYNVVARTPFGRDIFAELRAACERYGLLLGAYYSHWLDWHHPGGGRPQWPEIPADPVVAQPSDAEFEEYFTRKCLPQVKELLEKYNIRFFWFDNWCESPFLTPERLERLIALVHSHGGIVNSRIGVTWNHPAGNDAGVDYLSMGDNQFPDRVIDRPWETSGTFNESWGCNRLDFRWKATRELLKHLISNTARNGNYQLNVGPLADGTFPGPSVRRLREIGAWLKVNGEAIYGAAHAELPEPAWGRITAQREGRLYAHLFEPSREIAVEGLSREPLRAEILETGQPVPFRFQPAAGHLELEIPAEALADDSLQVVRIRFRH